MSRENESDLKVGTLSVFFPFWNEEKNIESVVTKAIPVAKKIARKWEIIMVDDGSSDRTLEIANRLAKDNKHLVVVRNKRNMGYGAAIRQGFNKAQYSFVVFMDGDDQFKFSEVSRFFDKIKESDIVMGYREKRFDNPFRHALMNLLRIWDFLFFGLYFRDIDCGFKMFRREALVEIMPLRSEGAMITTEILAKAKIKKLKIEQVRVIHYPRKFGDQSGGNLRVILRAIKESFMVWQDLHYGRY